MAFVMRDGWKREPLSTTGADYVEPSAAATLKPAHRDLLLALPRATGGANPFMAGLVGE